MSIHPAHDALREILVDAGRYALAGRQEADVEWKEDGSPVTSVDRELDARIAEGLARAFADAGVRGEEGAHEEGPGGTFYVDPIDGTRAFMQGLAYWGPTVALVRGGQLELGALYLPMLDDWWFAARGAGAWRNGERLTGPATRGRRRDRILFAPSRIHDAPPGLWPGKVRVLGSAAAHLALVAAGSGSAALIPEWSLWDVGCGALLVTESGGVLCGLDGSAVDLVGGERGLPFLAGAPTALQDVVQGLRGHQGSAEDARVGRE
ncbi:MAG: inositol monophosphatase [Myxococcales bacterium]|nr:inositol monophosphatase [Myxococcales bacterium]